MTPDPAPPTTSRTALVGYTLLCLTALLGMVLVLLENEREPTWVVLLAAVGALGVAARWRVTVPLVLLGLATLELYTRATWMREFGGLDWQDTGFTDGVLCGFVLAYSAGQYRLLSLKHAAFPIDTRRPPAANARRAKPVDMRQRRSAHLLQPWEAPALAITGAGWTVAVSLFWMALSLIPPPLGMTGRLWRGLLLIFTVGLTTAVLGGIVAYLNWLTATPAEHLLFLQDQAWRATRREQNQINRWLTWARLRGQRRKEKT